MGHSTRRLMMGAAGAGGDSTYIDDVFSTYLWRGDGNSGRPISNGIKLSNDNAGDSVQFVASSSQYLKVPQHSSLELGTGDYCIECWVRPTRSGSPNEGIWTYGSYDGNGGMLAWIHGNELKIFCARTNANICQVSNWRQQNVWTHLAVTRYSGTTKTFSNGVEIATSTEQNNDNVGEAANNMNQFFLGCERNNTNNIGGFFEGNISNMRIVKGSAVYTSNFTPPTKALTSTTNTLVLFCQSSTSATAATKTPIAITSSGNPTTIGFGPFTATDGEGGLAWMKSRTTGNVNVLFDTERGANQRLRSDADFAQTNSDLLQPSFTNSGFTVGSGNEVNGSGNDYTSWTFRKAKGFFDVIKWTGGGETYKNISHSLGSVPGCIIVKKYAGGSGDWFVYHRELNNGTNSWQYRVALNKTWTESSTGQSFFYSAPTATQFQIGDWFTNSGTDYIAYVFAGGESTADAARSVDFDGSDVCWSDSSDNTLGTSDFTLEYWFKADSNPSSGNDSYIVDQNNNYWSTRIQPDGTHQYLSGASVRLTSTTSLGEGQWHHIAIVRSSGTSRMYVNGVQEGGTYSDSTNYNFTLFYMGRRENGTNPFDGKISNLRLVVGTAVYTSSFRPPTEPLTNITNTKLLALNNSSVTGTTVGTIAVSGNSGLLPTASTDSPFDDPEGFKFGEGGDQNIIKTGSYTGNGSSNGPEVYVGWEPQWVLIKNANASEGWRLFDSMRGIATNGVDARLFPNTVDAESAAADFIDLTPTGFKLKDNGGAENGNGNTMTYIAIRRPDGYVGKPIEAGTDAFAMDTGNSSSTIPVFDSGFPVDMAFERRPATTDNWYTPTRLTGEKYLLTNANNSDNSSSSMTWDSNVGWSKDQAPSTYQSWMWKRHAGFTVCTWKGDGVIGRQIAHDMNKIPEMIWLKKRTGTARNWPVYHKGLNGGSSPENYVIWLNLTNAESQAVESWNDTAPTSTHFTIHGTANEPNTNTDGEDYIAMLFASVEGISKVGYYAGSNSEQTISCGFQPRFAIIRNISMTEDWGVYDTLRGWSSGNDKYLKLNDTPAQSTYDFGQPTSTGFTLVGNNTAINKAGNNFIFYAHA